jgi:hypothetical protein
MQDVLNAFDHYRMARTHCYESTHPARSIQVFWRSRSSQAALHIQAFRRSRSGQAAYKHYKAQGRDDGGEKDKGEQGGTMQC